MEKTWNADGETCRMCKCCLDITFLAFTHSSRYSLKIISTLQLLYQIQEEIATLASLVEAENSDALKLDVEVS
jgi:cell division protein FtsL